MPGPKPTPTAIKKKLGNPGHQKLNDKEPVAPNGVIACPQYLTGPARSEWFRLRPILDAMGTLKPVDRNILAAYCQAYGRYVEAEKVLREKGPLYRTKSDNVITSPMLWVSNKAVEQMLKLGAELGIGAATRSRVQVEKEPTLDDQLEGILRGRD
jgi:P27 family predicted phage terminase small subunit